MAVRICLDLLLPGGRRAQCNPVGGYAEVHALDYVLLRRVLRLGLLGQESERREEILEGEHGRLAEDGVVEAVEVVHVVARRQEEEAPQELLERVGSPVEVPDRRRGTEIHGEVVPKGDAVSCAQERAALRRHPDRPLPVRIEEVVAEDLEAADEVVGWYVVYPHRSRQPGPGRMSPKPSVMSSSSAFTSG